MNPTLLKRLFPHGYIVLSFVVITLIYFLPQFQGKTLYQQDIRQWKGSYEETRKTIEKTGKQPLWSNSMFSGMPTYQIGAASEYNYSYYVNKTLRLGLDHPAGDVFLLMLGFYILMMTLGINPWLAAIGAVAYAFSSYNIINIEAGHATKVMALAYAPLMLAGVCMGFKGKWLPALILSAIGVSGELFANHVQITYYTFFIIVFWGMAELFMAFREKRMPTLIKGLAGTMVGAIIGLGMNLTLLTVTQEYSHDTIRGESEIHKNSGVQTGGLDIDYATQWSNGNLEPLTILISDLYGGASNRALSSKSKTGRLINNPEAKLPVYFGPQPFTSGPIYFGAGVVFLAILCLFIAGNPITYALFAVSILAFFLSMGKNFMGLTELFFDIVPLYNKFRAVTMIMIIGQIAFPILAIMGAQKILNTPPNQRAGLYKKLITTFSIVGGICALFALMPSLFVSFKGPDDAKMQPELVAALAEDRESLLRTDAFRSLFFIGLIAATLLYFIRGRLKNQHVMIVLGVALIVDLIWVDWRYLNHKEFKPKQEQQDFAPTEADQAILQDPNPHYRVLNLSGNPFAEATTSYFHKSIGGYHGAKFRRYQDVKDHLMNQQWAAFGRTQEIDSALSLNSTLNMLNGRYVIFGQEGRYTPLLNKYALGNAWFVNGVKYVANADEEINYIGRVFNIIEKSENISITVNGMPLQGSTLFGTDDIKINGEPFEPYVLNLNENKVKLMIIKEKVQDPETKAMVEKSKLGMADSSTTGPFIMLELAYDFKPDLWAVADKKYEAVLGKLEFGETSDSIYLTKYNPDELIYKSTASKDRLAVFSEVFYDKGWNVYIDDKKAEYGRVNFILRGLKVPAGKHTIRFVFEPKTWENGEKVAMISSILFFISLGGGGFLLFRKKKNK